MIPAFSQLLLVFISGVLGSAHCIGMCGGIAATMSLGAGRLRSAVVRQLAWSSGRIVTYCFLGVLISAVGAKLLRAQGQTVWLQSVFAIVAGVLLMLQGLHAAGWISFRIRRKATAPCLTRSVFAQFFSGGSATGAFVAGLLTGFLPCGLVYSFLALAASSGHVAHGVLIMLAFGLGTIPVMVVTGAGLSLATMNVRRKLIQLAAVSVIVTGMMTTARGITFAINSHTKPATTACPLCTSSPPPHS